MPQQTTPGQGLVNLNRGGYSPFELAKALRQEYPGQFDSYDDAEVIKAVRELHPEVYQLVDPLLEGAELLAPTKGAPAPPAGRGRGAGPVGTSVSASSIAPPPPAPPSTFDEVIGTGLRVVPAMAGSMLAAPLEATGAGAPAGAIVSGISGATGEFLGQSYEKMIGTRDSYTPSTMLVEAGLNAFPLHGVTEGMGRIGRTVMATGTGAALGATSAAMRQITDRQQIPTLQDVTTGLVAGGAFGAGMHGASEGISALGRLPGDLSPEGMGLPHPAEPAGGTGVAFPENTHNTLINLEDFLQQVQLSKRMVEVARQHGRGPADIPKALEVKDYLAQMAELGQSPVAIPPIQPGLEPPVAPPQQKLLPERSSASTILAYPPDADPNLIDHTGSQTPLAVIAQHPVEAAIEQGLQGAPGPPRLVTSKSLNLLPPEGAAEGAVPPPPAPLVTPGPPEAPLRQTARMGGRQATPEQPRLPGSDRPMPLAERPYTEGPNAGPRVEGEQHGTPRMIRRYKEVAGKKVREEYPAQIPAEDPGTYPPEVRRELARMAHELEIRPHERVSGGVSAEQIRFMVESGAAANDSDAIAQLKASGATSGGAIAGAPVYHEILDAAGTGNHATRATVLQGIRRALLEGKGSLISDAAAQVARGRMTQEASAPGARILGKHSIISKPGAGDDLIGWVDAAGNKALPAQDLDEYAQAAREMEDGELYGTLKLLRAHPADAEVYDPGLLKSIRDEGVRRGMIRPEQPGLVMEAPGGAGGPDLFSFEGNSPVRQHVYHGSAEIARQGGLTGGTLRQDLTPAGRPRRVGDLIDSLGTWWTSSKKDAEYYSQHYDAQSQKQPGAVIEGDITLHNPKVFKSAADYQRYIDTFRQNIGGGGRTPPDGQAFRAALEADGHDGFIVRGGGLGDRTPEGADFYLSFDNHGVKVGALEGPPTLRHGIAPVAGDESEKRYQELLQHFETTHPADQSIPGLEGVREEDRPLPPVAEEPFTLTPPPPKPAAKLQAEMTARRQQGSLLDHLKGEEGVLILDVPAGDKAGLKKWLAKQEADHGHEAWFNRAEQALEDGDGRRAWKIAASASVRSYSTLYNKLEDPRDIAQLEQSVKGTPLQGMSDINAQIVAQGREGTLGKPAPSVADYPPTLEMSQAGAARGKAKVGPAGIVNPGPPQRPLEPKYTDHLLSKGLMDDILKATDPDLITLVPGNRDSALRLFRQVGDLSLQGANTREVKQYLKLSDQEIAQHYLRSVSDAARILQQLSAFRQTNAETLDQLANQMSMGGALRGMLGGEAPAVVGKRGRVIGQVGTIEPERTLEALAESTRSFDQAMLLNVLQKPKKVSELETLQAASYPFMISKWATAVRNAVTQAGRYGVEALDDALTIPLAKLLGDSEGLALAKGMATERVKGIFRSGAKVSPIKAYGASLQEIYDITADSLAGMSPKDARASLKVLAEFPTEAANFLGWAGGEENAAGPSRFKALNALVDPKVQRFLTVFNRAQEFTGRGVVFDATMRAQLTARGLDPNVVLQGTPGEIATAVGGARQLDELIHNSVASALEATFASRGAAHSIPGALVRFVNQAWPIKLAYPFPKFNLVSAPRFVWDHGPWALVDLIRFPVDTWSGARGGSRLTRGVRAQRFEQQDIPELVGKRQTAEGQLGSAVRDLMASRRELTVRNRQITRLQGRSGGELPEAGDQLQQAIDLRDQLQRRVTAAQEAIGQHKRSIRDLAAQEESLLDAVRDAHGIGAPNFAQYFARIGTGTFAGLGAAFVIRSQPAAQGTRWYEYKVDREGKDPMILDFRAFAPFAQYLFVADVMQDFYHQTDWKAAKAQAEEEGVGGVGTPLEWSKAMWDHYEGKYTAQELGAQFAQAFLSMSRAAGTTLTITDLLTQNGWPSLQDAADSIVGTIGQFLSRFTIPLQQGKDLAAMWDPEEAKARIPPRPTLEEPTRPLAAPLANVPYLSQLIPDKISQTTGKALGTEYPAARNLAGVSSSARDFVTEEVRRVGVPGSSVYIRETGDVGLDRTIAESYSKILQEELPDVLEDPGYRSLGTPAKQRDFLQRFVFPALKRAALAEARDTLGDDRFESATVTGEAARKKQRQLALIDQLEGAEPPVEGEPPEDQPEAVPSPPSAGDTPGLQGPPPPPF